MLGQRLAEWALSPEVRPKIIARTRGLIRDGFAVVADFVARHDNHLSVVPPAASAMCFIRTRGRFPRPICRTGCAVNKAC